MSEWQPIETAPRDIPILVNCGSGRPKIVSWVEDARYEGGGVWGLCDHGLQVAYRPTLWTPLPMPPVGPVGRRRGRAMSEQVKLPREHAPSGRCWAHATFDNTDVWCWRCKGHSGAHRGSNRFYSSHRVEWPSADERAGDTPADTGEP
jgi:hypothetical protein